MTPVERSREPSWGNLDQWEPQISRNSDASSWWGQGAHEAMFPSGSGPLRPVPFPRAKRSRTRFGREQDKVVAAIRAQNGVEDVDPRTLSANQPSITSPGLAHYMKQIYYLTGDTYEEGHDPGNKTPIVYIRDGTEVLILAGHHRSSAALLRAEPVRAIVVRGGWGPSR